MGDHCSWQREQNMQKSWDRIRVWHVLGTEKMAIMTFLRDHFIYAHPQRKQRMGGVGINPPALEMKDRGSKRLIAGILIPSFESQISLFIYLCLR